MGGIFRISGVWHVGWWNLIASVRLIQVALSLILFILLY